MGFLGADVVALEDLAVATAARREAIVGLVHEVGVQLDAVVWSGPDAEVLRVAWAEGLARLVVVADEVLSDIESQSNLQAGEQRAASEL